MVNLFLTMLILFFKSLLIKSSMDYYKLRNIYFLIVCFIIFIIPVISFILNCEVIYCTDGIAETIASLKSDIDYWQCDLLGLEDQYKANDYGNRSDSSLSVQELQHKKELEESMNDGKNNVNSLIGQLRELRQKQAAFETAPVTIGKREISDVQDAEMNISKKKG
jgi:hypothetical protein